MTHPSTSVTIGSAEPVDPATVPATDFEAPAINPMDSLPLAAEAGAFSGVIVDEAAAAPQRNAIFNQGFKINLAAQTISVAAALLLDPGQAIPIATAVSAYGFSQLRASYQQLLPIQKNRLLGSLRLGQAAIASTALSVIGTAAMAFFDNPEAHEATYPNTLNTA